MEISSPVQTGVPLWRFRSAARRMGLLAATLLLATACKQTEVEHELSERYGDCFISRDSTGHHYSVLFTDVAFAERPEADRARIARKVAEFVRDNEPLYKGVQDVKVEFPTKKELADVNLKRVAATYTFTRAELGDPTTTTVAVDTT